jgi:hypothetical protein
LNTMPLNSIPLTYSPTSIQIKSTIMRFTFTVVVAALFAANS